MPLFRAPGRASALAQGSDGLVASEAAAAPAPTHAAPRKKDKGEGHGKFGPGAPGIGDPYFPLEGNGGYDTQHYDLSFSYDPASDRLEGVAIITAKATQDLSRFDLDLQQLDVSSVTVDRHPATLYPRRAGAADHAPQRHP